MATEQAVVMKPAMSVDDMLAMRKSIKDLASRVFSENVDFQRVKGVTDRSVLLKPGAEKLATFFGLEVMPPDLVGSQEDWTGDDSKTGRPLFYYVVRQTLAKNGVPIASQCGSCSSEERRYRYRLRNRVCPHCGKEEVRRSTFQDSPDVQPGWYCWAKAGGCGSKFRFDDQEICRQNADPVENEYPADIANTILKMAEKRAFVAAVLIATNTSDMYTQDLEDSPEESENSKGAGIPRSASKPTNADGKPDDSGMDENARITPEMLAYFDKVRSSLGRRTDKAGDETIARFLSRGPNKQEIQTAADMTVKTYRYVLGHMEQNPNAWKIRPKPGSKA